METKTAIKPERVKAIMSEMGLNIAEMASKLGVSREVLSRKLNGHINWTLTDLVTIRDMSGKSLDYICGLNNQ